MAGFRSIAEVTQAVDAGQYHLTGFRKVQGAASGQAAWYDLAPASGNPTPFYYASSPLEARQMSRSLFGGINHGPDVPEGVTKHVLRYSSLSQVPLVSNVCDYLMYYPFIEQGEVARQDLINNVALPRYTDGDGVKMMMVNVAPGDAAHQFRVGYTNSEGVSGRVTPDHRSQAGTGFGHIVTSFAMTNLPGFAGPYLTLQAGDKGVRSVDYVEMITPSAGLNALVLVKPLFTHTSLDATAMGERNFGVDFPVMPEVKNDAYLNIIAVNGTSSAIAQTNGIAEFVWN